MIDIKKIEYCLRHTIRSHTALAGGDIASAYKLTTTGGETFFCKTAPNSKKMFLKEADGLAELAKSGAIRIPNVIYADDNLLILEFIASTTQRLKNFFEVFGRSFAALHSFHSDFYGFKSDNYIGATEQINTPIAHYKAGSGAKTWSRFYYENRLLYQYQLLEKRALTNPKMRQLFKNLSASIDKLLDADEEPPSLLHGDLWSGNFIIDEQGYPCLIDPATYYGHREADLAMTTLFGGFDPEFYRSYQEVLPLAEGWQRRRPLYQLYHLMNHLNLFGQSYFGQVMAILEEYA